VEPAPDEQVETLLKAAHLGGIAWIPASQAEVVFKDDILLREWAPESKAKLPGLLFRLYSYYRHARKPVESWTVRRRAAEAIGRMQAGLPSKGEVAEARKNRFKVYRGLAGAEMPVLKQ
jgi:hypothetical protein